MKFPKPKLTKKRIFLTTLLLVVIGLAFMTISDQYRHHQLNYSIDKLQSALTQQGITAKKTSGCGRPYVEFGRGSKECSISLVADIEASNISSAGFSLNKFRKAIGSSQQFIVRRQLPTTVKGRDNFTFGYGIFNSSVLHRLCTARYDFNESAKNMRLSFSCDDTSWFIRTFNF